MGKILDKIESMTELIEENPDNEFTFAVAVDYKTQRMSGFMQVPKDQESMMKATEALADMFYQRPDYAVMFTEAFRMYFYKQKKKN